MQRAYRAWFVFDRGLEGIVGTLFTGLMGLTCLQIALRYLFNTAIDWADEVVRYLFIWIVAFAAPLATLHAEHFLVTIVPDVLPPRARRLLVRGTLVTTAGFLVVLAWLGLRFASAMQGRVSSALELPMPVIYASVPVASVLMLVNTLRLMRYPRPGDGPHASP